MARDWTMAIWLLSSTMLVAPARAEARLEWWVSTAAGDQKLAAQTAVTFASGAPAAADVLRVDPGQSFQTIVGFGSSLEPTTCFNLTQLDPQTRAETVARLVDPERGIGMNLMRISIGTPDFTGDPWYSYDDLPPGETDPEMTRFSIEKDRAYILPILRLAREQNPELRFFASPWSPPAWMKTSQSLIGGSLKPEWYAAYARYFVRFLEAYAAEGIGVSVITVQNEPGVDRSRDAPKWHYPSCRWTGESERDFIRDHLGPALRAAGLETQIWCYDHNYNVERSIDDDPGLPYPRAVLSDPAAAEFVAGTAFHGYAGQPEGMGQFAREFPAKSVHFSEGSMFGLPGAQMIVRLLSNGAASYNAWVTMIDQRGKPNNGPFVASKTCIMLRDDRTVDYRFDYYMYGQFMKFVARGAQRIGVEVVGRDVAAVAFRNPDGELVAVVVHTGKAPRPVSIALGDRSATVELPARAVATLRWTPET